MSFDITPEDLDVLGQRFKAAIRKAKSNAGKMEKALGISKGSLSRMYKGKYPLRAEMLVEFADIVGVEPLELVTGTVFAVMHGYEEAAPPREPTPEPAPRKPTLVPTDMDALIDTQVPKKPEVAATPQIPQYRPRKLEATPSWQMDVPLEEQKTLTDEDEAVPTEQGAVGRIVSPNGDDDPELEYVLDLDEDELEFDDDDLELDELPEDGTDDLKTVESLPEDLIKAVRAKQSEPPHPHPAAEKQEEPGLLSSITSRFKGLFG